MKHAIRLAWVALCGVLLAACDAAPPAPGEALPPTAPAALPIGPTESVEPVEPPVPPVAGAVQLTERYLTARDAQDNVDSLATWRAPDGQHWLIATAKETDRLLVYDAADGKLLRKVGQSGSAPGEFSRPNGVFVIDDLLLVVERDNRRVQLLSLPEFKPLTLFGGDGDEALRKPYGLWVQKLADEVGYRVFVTDNYELADGSVPPANQLGERVQQFVLRSTATGWSAARERRFGATEGPGVLNIVESVWGDPTHGVLMLADEEEYRERNIKVYGMDGQYRGRRMGAGVFRYQPEGIALYTCADGGGFWITTDQGKQHNYFHLFARQSLDYLGSFEGRTVLNTDGIWLNQQALPGFVGGALFAVHDDGSAAAFDLAGIIEALRLPACATP